MDPIPVEQVVQKDKLGPLKSAGHLIDIEAMDEYEKSIRESKSAVPGPSFWKGRRVLITGSAGMVGSTMIDLLISMDAKVAGTVKRHALPDYPNVMHNVDSGKLHLYEVDLTDYNRVASLIKEFEPEFIFHQAAESFVPTSLQQPSHVVENNCVSTTNLLEAATKEDKSLKGIQLACSSEQYGFVKDASELPVREENELRPTSTYASTKVFTEFIGKSYFYTYKTPTVITRSFNQEGPRRGPQFFTARIGHQMKDILSGKSNRIVMGNPNAVRDFTHIHDSVKAQLLALEKCERGQAYNICSGKGITTGDYATLATRVWDVKAPIFVDKRLLRPYERGEALFDGFIGDNRKFSEKTGWKPTLTVTDIIRDSVKFYQDPKAFPVLKA
ncbi:MAG: GDP-mannose 4,6-dehydratase [Candidatus Micrarchaeota archaeon]